MKIAVAMSGGVDSSVAAALLKEEGHEVIGLTMLVIPEDKTSSFNASDYARQVADAIGIPHHVIDLRKIFAERIISEFCEQYSYGKTPNPCVRCNRFVKFGFLYEKAKELGADMLASGHYARIEKDKTDERYSLRKGVDRRRDQSYFLYALTQEQLGRTCFPLGSLTKNSVKQIAGELKLPAVSSESREICFIPDNDYVSFLKERVKSGTGPGTIIDVRGNTLGEHRGIINYTIGQRKRLGIAAKQPLYVIAIDSRLNTVAVGEKEHLFSTEFMVSEVNWIRKVPLSVSLLAGVKIRYRHPEAEAVVISETEDTVRVKFKEPQISITPGQAAVFYDGDMVVGGGTIEEVVRN